ncbi:MAG: gamma-glutamylcyclotransferase [Alphaproteobacteria bacterium]|nr:gamma-glutamylcyclotransferase [Alphaproteobacteria bacterium]
MRFFFYGTLLPGSCNAVAAAVHRKLTRGIPAFARGHLHAVPDPAGWYPAFRADPAGEQVRGMLCTALPDFTPADLAALDFYENFRPDDHPGSEYLRREITVSTGEGRQLACAYLYRDTLPEGSLPVPGGDFRAFLAQTGLPEYRGCE